MKKVLSFVGCALFVAAMTVSCGNKNTEATDSIEAVEEVVVDQPAAVEACCDADAEMMAAAQKAAEEICNCASADQSKIAACMKQILATSYQAYQNNDKFVKAVEQGVGECAMNKAKAKVAEEANKAVDKAAEELAKKVKF
ncbi:MAG: hypothetical protein ACSW8I_00420 [bacterium]